MASTPVKNIVLKKGEDYSATAVVTDVDTGEAIDISGWDLQADIKSSFAIGGAILASFTFDFITDGTDGQYERSMATATIEALAVSSAVWDQFYIEDGVSTKLMRGTVTVEESATDPDA